MKPEMSTTNEGVSDQEPDTFEDVDDMSIEDPDEFMEMPGCSSGRQRLLYRRKLRRKKTPRLRPYRKESKPRNFRCWLCDHNFTKRSDLVSHLEENHQDVDSAYGDSRLNRVNSVSGDDPEYTCMDCGLQFQYPCRLLRHFNQTHANPASLPFQCAYCPWRFAIRINCERHEEKVHGPNRSRKYECAECKAGYLNKSGFSKHIKKVHQSTDALWQKTGRFYCRICTHSFEASDFLSHVRDKHPMHAECVCHDCGEIFDRKAYLKAHKCLLKPSVEEADSRTDNSVLPRTGYNPEQEQQPLYVYKCPICRQLFQYRAAYAHHIKDRHTKPNLFVCNICEADFAVVNDLVRHTKREHILPHFQCKICGRKLKNNRSLELHVALHYKAFVPKFQCPVCGEFFGSVDDVNCHRTEEDHWPGIDVEQLEFEDHGEPSSSSHFATTPTTSLMDSSTILLPNILQQPDNMLLCDSAIVDPPFEDFIPDLDVDLPRYPEEGIDPPFH